MTFLLEPSAPGTGSIWRLRLNDADSTFVVLLRVHPAGQSWYISTPSGHQQVYRFIVPEPIGSARGKQ